MARTGSLGLTLAETLGMSAYQQQLMAATWPRVAKSYTSGSTVAVFEVRMEVSDKLMLLDS